MASKRSGASWSNSARYSALLRVAPGEFLPPFPEIAAQLTGSEWLQNLPGTYRMTHRAGSRKMKIASPRTVANT